MTPFREAVALPAIFLTVALLGGLRIGADVRLIPPPLASLVLGMLLVGALARARVLAPDALMHARRSPLENTSGAIVLITLFAASAQVFNLLTPERGLLHALFTIFFVVQLLTTLAAVSGRVAMLRGLLVLLAAAFVLRFIILESLYSPGGGMLSRLLTAALEGVTLGSFDYDANAAATGYIGFLTLALYFIGLILLAPPSPSALECGSPLPRLPETTTIATLLVLAGFALSPGCARDREEEKQTGASPSASAAAKSADTDATRLAALRSARVWR